MARLTRKYAQECTPQTTRKLAAYHAPGADGGVNNLYGQEHVSDGANASAAEEATLGDVTDQVAGD